MVGGRQRREADLVVARLGQALHHRFHHVVGRALAHGAVHHARLAEAAAAGAPAQDLDVQPIVHHLGERHDARLPARAFREALEQALLDAQRQALFQRLDPRARFLRLVLGTPAVQRRHVPARLVGQRAQDVGARSALGAQAADDGQAARQGLLPFADAERVEERRVGLGVVGAGAAPHHERVAFGALVCMQRDACQIERLKHVRSRQLVRQCDAHGVELGERRAALYAEQRDALGAQRVAHGGRRKKRALGGHPVDGVHHVHEDAQRLVRLPQLVGIGIHHAEAEVRFGLVHAAELVVEVARGALRSGEQRLQTRPEIHHQTRFPSSVCFSGRISGLCRKRSA